MASLAHRDSGARLTIVGWAVGIAAMLGAFVTPVLVASAAGASTTGVTMTAVKTSGFGTVLSDGDTVYTLKPSSKPCTAQCLKIWPPVELPSGVKHATAGSGVAAAKLGTAKMHGGGLQVTYGGKRLYFFYKDTAPGQVNGNVTDKWGKWSAVVLSKSPGSNSGSGTSSAGTGGASF